MDRISCSAVALCVAVVCATASEGFSQPPPPPTAPTQQSAPVPSSSPAERLHELLPSLDDKTRHGLALQVALDRAGFSPGEIDGAPGGNTDRAMTAFKAAHGTTDLGKAYSDPVVAYTITAEDVAGPFAQELPEDMIDKAKLQSLSYTSVVELLAERFHSNPKLLQRLNPNATFAEGEVITVPNVEPFFLPVTETPAKGAEVEKKAGKVPDETVKQAAAPEQTMTVIISERSKTLQVQDGSGKVIFHAPVTVGSQNDPLPVGEWKVNGVSRNPVFNYNPELFWDADPSHAKAKVAPGPNNPVGVVWIDLSKEHYGVHGTPEPSRVGYTESHGCIRLTNWDAMRVAELVKPGTKVILR